MPVLNELKCSNCGKLLAKVVMQVGTVEVKCKCGTMNTVAANNERIIIHNINGKPFEIKSK